MIKEACASDSGFVLCMLDSGKSRDGNKHIFPIGTLVKVVDFCTLEDGLLGVTVEGVQCVTLSKIETEEDGLRIGQWEPISGWVTPCAGHSFSLLPQRLEQIYQQYPELGELYPEARFDDPLWVLFRWLEILPLEPDRKQKMLASKDLNPLMSYLNELLE